MSFKLILVALVFCAMVRVSTSSQATANLLKILEALINFMSLVK